MITYLLTVANQKYYEPEVHEPSVRRHSASVRRQWASVRRRHPDTTLFTNRTTLDVPIRTCSQNPLNRLLS